MRPSTPYDLVLPYRTNELEWQIERELVTMNKIGDKGLLEQIMFSEDSMRGPVKVTLLDNDPKRAACSWGVGTSRSSRDRERRSAIDDRPGSRAGSGPRSACGSGVVRYLGMRSRMDHQLTPYVVAIDDSGQSAISPSIKRRCFFVGGIILPVSQLEHLRSTWTAAHKIQGEVKAASYASALGF